MPNHKYLTYMHQLKGQLMKNWKSGGFFIDQYIIITFKIYIYITVTISLPTRS